MKRRKKLFLAIVLLLILLQFIPVEKPIVINDNKADLIASNEMDDTVAELLKSSCYDCHSYETNLPWYSHVFPSSLLVARDTKVGREELNFSNWEEMSKMKKIKNLNKIEEEILSGEMPMGIYLIMHPKAKLNEQQKSAISQWVDAYSKELIGK